MTNHLTIQELEIITKPRSFRRKLERRLAEQLLATMQEVESLKAMRFGQEKAHDRQMEYGAELYQRTLKENERLRGAFEFILQYNREDKASHLIARKALATGHVLPNEFPSPNPPEREVQ